VEADEDTDVEVAGDAEAGPDAGGAAKSRRKTRSAVAKQSVKMAAATVSAVKDAEKKKKRKRKASPLPAVETPVIPTQKPPVVEDRPARRSESPAAKRQREFVQKTTEDALRQGLEAQRTAALTQAKMPASIRPQFFRSKPRVPAVKR
jgi:hypothetical protein